ncbi:hypothetical protein [Vreelandella aquamarina]|uniref:hypothetical protein n=1 Tax=Vreelandella aquamarina TaxID=77097 RepID=UPI0007823B00|nr:hypothetical protein [Halomonas axialensis]
MSYTRHPSRDALLRDALGRLREQRGIACERFARELNRQVMACCPAKAADLHLPDLDGFTTVGDEYDHAVMSWAKRVQRWASGAVEFPAWLEEPWCAALEVFGDDFARVSLTRRHGFMGVKRPESGDEISCGFAALGEVSRETGDVMAVMSRMLHDNKLSPADLPMADEALAEIDDAIVALMSTRSLIERKVLGRNPGVRLAVAKSGG